MARATFKKRKNPVLLIIGIVILLCSIPVYCLVFEWYIWSLAIIFAILDIVALVLIVSGIGQLVSVSKYNRALDQEAYRNAYTGKCIRCGREITVRITDFMVHRRNYPEGYVDCPYCKEHISRNMFYMIPHKTTY